MIGNAALSWGYLYLNIDHYLRINEIKNYSYCFRIAYYTLCMRLDRETGLSSMGTLAEVETKRKMRRRQHALHAIVNGERHYNVMLISHKQRLIGRLDELIVTNNGCYLIDYKDTNRDHGYWKTQMCAYKICAAEQGFHVLGCYIYTIPTQQYVEIHPTPRDEKRVIQLRDTIEQMITTEICPDPTPHYSKCHVCQYRRFCNDVE